MSRQLPHGASTGIDGNEAYTIFSEVVNHLENVDARHKTFYGKCKVNEKDAWGKGLHIFIPGKREGILAGTRNHLLPLITTTPIQAHCPKRWYQWNKAWVNERTVEGCCNWIISPQVGGLDEVGDIYKFVSYFARQASGWKDSFYQTEYILEEVLGKDGSQRKKDVTSILNQISDAHLITKGHRSTNRL